MEESIATPSRSEETPEVPAKSPRPVLGPSMRIYRGDRITVDLPKEIHEMLNELLNQTNYDAEEIFFRSLILYKAAVDATIAGKSVAILDPDGEIDREIINL